MSSGIETNHTMGFAGRGEAHILKGGYMMMEQCKNEKRLDALERTLNGNGTEGVRVKMVRLEENIKRLSWKMNLNNWLTFALLGAIISTIFKAWS